MHVRLHACMFSKVNVCFYIRKHTFLCVHDLHIYAHIQAHEWIVAKRVDAHT